MVVQVGMAKYLVAVVAATAAAGASVTAKWVAPWAAAVATARLPEYTAVAAVDLVGRRATAVVSAVLVASEVGATAAAAVAVAKQRN